ncbi:MAG TPA: hypothetical protein VFV90_11180 [Usitatibacter sp.]|nr:hypothetical protein [Usitatibacter sp.]
MRLERRPMRPEDLFVVLDKAYRRRARRCGNCGFSLPFPVFRDDEEAPASWSVIPSDQCTPECLDALDELVASFQKSYRLSEPSGSPGLM